MVVGSPCLSQVLIVAGNHHKNPGETDPVSFAMVVHVHWGLTDLDFDPHPRLSQVLIVTQVSCILWAVTFQFEKSLKAGAQRGARGMRMHAPRGSPNSAGGGGGGGGGKTPIRGV